MHAQQPAHISPQDEHGGGKDRHLLSELSAAFGALDRLVTLLRVYPMSHPLVDSFSQQIADRINALTAASGALSIKLAPSHLITERGDKFFTHEPGREHFLWFQPFSDGMSALIFEPDLDADELQRLMLIISRADMRQLPPDDDAVTAIWEADLAHIHVESLDGFVDAGEGGALGDMSEAQACTLVVQTVITPRAEGAKRLIDLIHTFPATPLDVFTMHHLRDAAQVTRTSAGADELAEALRVDPAWLDRLMAEWTAGADLEYRLVEALLSIARTAPGTPAAARATDTIVALTTQLFQERAWPSVIALVRLLRTRQAMFSGDQDPLAPILALISDPLQLEALIYLCQKDRAARPHLIELLGLLDHDMVRGVLLRSLADDKKELPAPDALVGVLLAVSDERSQRDWGEPALLASHVYLTRMTHALRGQPLGTFARAANQLYTAALTHQDPALRRAALLAYSPDWCPPSALAQHVEPLMSDPEEELRQLAMDLLRRERPESFSAKLHAIIAQRDFAHRQPGELRFLFKHFLEIAPQGAETLRGLLDTWGWMSPSRRAVAASAARLLVEAGDDPSIALIQRYSAAFWISPRLRQEYKRLTAPRALEAT